MIVIDWVIHQLHTNMFSSGALIATMTGAILYWIRGLPKVLKGAFIYCAALEVTIRSNTDIFDDACRWVERENFLAKSRRFQLYDYLMDNRNIGNISFANGYHWFWYEGRPVIFSKEIILQNSAMYKIPEEIRLLFLFRRDKSVVTRALQAILDKDNSVIEIKTYTSGWETATRRNHRLLSSVIMDSNVKQDLLFDIDKFYSNKHWYIERGVLYKRGYLFYGLPGTGKSSLILAIASKYNKTLYSINLKTLNDTSLIQAFISIPPDSIILLEDIDAVSDVVFNRSDDTANNKNTVSLSTLLNVLDGIFSKEDALIIMTSNYPEKLDSALLRNGRVDKRIEFKYFPVELASEMFDVFHPNCAKAIKDNFLERFEYPIPCSILQEELLQLNPNE